MALSPWITHVAQLPECKFKVTKNPLTATFTYPGFNFSNFDSNNMVDVMSLLQYADDALTCAQFYPYKEDEDRWVEWADVCRGHLTFILSLETVVSRHVYNITVPKWSFQTRAILGYVGNSTVTFLLELHVPGYSESLLTQLVQFVIVDKHTRKAYPFPDWFKNKYKDQCFMQQPLRLEPFTRPEQTFVCRREVMWLETDRNAHTNFVSYVRYAVDGLHSALRHLSRDKTGDDTSQQVDPSSESDTFGASPRLVTQTTFGLGALKGMSKTVMKEGLKSVRICYIRECVEGDVLDVHIWQEEREQLAVRCSVEKGSQLICQLLLEYFSPLAKI